MKLIAETDRLLIRWLEEDDFDAFAEILGSNDVMEFSITKKGLTSEEARERFDKNFSEYQEHGFGVYAVWHKEDDRLIGIAGFRPEDIDGHMEAELIFRLAKNYWGQGYASEAAKACKQYAYDQFGMRRIICLVQPENERSVHVIEKLGMHYEKDTVIYGIPCRVYTADRFTDFE